MAITKGGSDIFTEALMEFDRDDVLRLLRAAKNLEDLLDDGPDMAIYEDMMGLRETAAKIASRLPQQDGATDVFFAMQDAGWTVTLHSGDPRYHPALAVGEIKIVDAERDG